MIYKVDFFDEYCDNSHAGYFSSKAAARRASAQWRRGGCQADSPRAAETPKTKAEVIALLERWGSHPFPGGC